jgi:hypothetical protein
MSPFPSPDDPSLSVTSFAVVAAADHGLLERVLAVLSRADVLPARFTSQRHRRSAMLALSIEAEGLDAGRRDLVAARLRGLVGVEKVFVAERGTG